MWAAFFFWLSALACWWFGSGGLVAFLMWSCSFFMSFGLERGSLWTRLILVIFDQGVQIQCQLFLLVQALIFGVPVVSLVL